MNSLLKTVVLVGTMLSPAYGDEIYKWMGKGGAVAAGEFSPLVEAGEMKVKELVFPDNGGKHRGGRQLQGMLDKSSFSQLTISLFLYPTRRDGNEDLITTKSESELSGFRLRQSWRVLIFEGGNGKETFSVKAPRPAGLLTLDSWQHITVVFDRGEVQFYRDGMLLGKERVPLEVITLDRKRLFIGSGAGEPPNNPYSFSGKMTGISINDVALSESEISEQMKEALEEAGNE